MRIRIVAFALATSLLLLSPQIPQAAEPPQPEHCAELYIGTDTMPPVPAGEELREMSVQELSDLQLLVVFEPRLEKDHLLAVRLLTPRGHHYQTLEVPVATQQDAQGSERRVASYPRPLPVQVVREHDTQNGPRLGTILTLPVAGTTIVNSSLYGTWQVEILLDGARVNCPGFRYTFTING